MFPVPVPRSVPSLALGLFLLLCCASAGADTPPLCLVDDHGECQASPADFLDRSHDPRLLFSAEQLLRQSCYSYLHGHDRLESLRFARLLERAADADAWTEDDQAAHDSLAAEYAAGAGAYCGHLADLSARLHDELPARLAEVHGDERLAFAARAWASLLQAAIPAGLGPWLRPGSADRPAVHHLDPVLDADVAELILCSLERPDDPRCRDQRLHRLALAAAHLPAQRLRAFDRALAGTLRLVLDALPPADDHDRLLRAAAPILLVVADQTKYRPPGSLRSRGASFGLLRERVDLFGGDPENPFEREICAYSVGAGHLACYRDFSSIVGGAPAVVASFLDLEQRLGTGSCGYDDMLRRGATEAFSGLVCKRDLCRGDGQGGEGDALRDLGTEVLGEAGLTGLRNSPPDFGAIPDRLDPIDPLGCTIGRAGFDVARCVDAVGQQGGPPQVGPALVGQEIEFFLGGCASPRADNGRTDEPPLAVADGEAWKERIIKDARSEAYDLMIDKAVEMTDWLAAAGHDSDTLINAMVEYAHAQEAINSSFEYLDLGDPEHIEVLREGCESSGAANVEACMEQQADEVMGVVQEVDGEWIAILNTHGLWVSSPAEAWEAFRDSIIEAAVRIAFKNTGLDALKAEQALCDLFGIGCATTGTETTTEEGDEEADDGSTQLCASSAGGCEDACGAGAEAARDLYASCLDGAQPLDGHDPWRPTSCRIPTTGARAA